MAVRAAAIDRKKMSETPRRRMPEWQTVLVCAVALALLAVGIWMRLHDLGLPIDRDSYDEGVYWQSLRAMSAGNTLYQQIFYSQPPFFLLSIFPTYTFFGQTLWAARLGVALMSLLGLLGAFLLGKALSGRIGAIAALLLLIADPLYLAQSQTLQAEAPSTAFSLLAVGLAYLWWERPDGLAGLSYAILCGITLSLSILCKLLAVSTLVPIGLLMIAHLWRVFQRQAERPKMRLTYARSLLAGIVAFIAMTAALLLPFIDVQAEMTQGVIAFHTSAAALYKSTQGSNLSRMVYALTSFTTLGATTLTALFGGVVALLRRDWRVLPLLAWLLATAALLWLQVPLFHHHFVALVPPLIALAVMGIGPIKLATPGNKVASIVFNGAPLLSIIVILVGATLNWQGEQLYYHIEQRLSINDDARNDAPVVKDLSRLLQPDQLVITDAQFLAGLADRSTPALLVDTSSVRINTGYITPRQLIQEASQPEVQAILFYSQRLLKMKNVEIFYTWMTHHFRLVHRYWSGKELWIKV